jgi:hypothetical protein
MKGHINILLPSIKGTGRRLPHFFDTGLAISGGGGRPWVSAMVDRKGELEDCGSEFRYYMVVSCIILPNGSNGIQVRG